MPTARSLNRTILQPILTFAQTECERLIRRVLPDTPLGEAPKVDQARGEVASASAIIDRISEKKPDFFATDAGRKKQESEQLVPKKAARRSSAPPERSAALTRTLASITKAEVRAVQTNARKAPATARGLAAQWRRTRNDKYLVEITATARAANMTTADLIDQAFDPHPGRVQLCRAIATACMR